MADDGNKHACEAAENDVPGTGHIKFYCNSNRRTDTQDESGAVAFPEASEDCNEHGGEGEIQTEARCIAKTFTQFCAEGREAEPCGPERNGDAREIGSGNGVVQSTTFDQSPRLIGEPEQQEACLAFWNCCDVARDGSRHQDMAQADCGDGENQQQKRRAGFDQVHADELCCSGIDEAAHEPGLQGGEAVTCSNGAPEE